MMNLHCYISTCRVQAQNSYLMSCGAPRADGTEMCDSLELPQITGPRPTKPLLAWSYLSYGLCCFPCWEMKSTKQQCCSQSISTTVVPWTLEPRTGWCAVAWGSQRIMPLLNRASPQYTNWPSSNMKSPRLQTVLLILLGSGVSQHLQTQR